MLSKPRILTSLLVGALMAGGALAQPQPAPAAGEGDTLIQATEPQPGPGGGTATAGMTTKCKFDKGPKAGTTFDFKVMGLHQIPVGVECQDGMGSTGISIP